MKYADLTNKLRKRFTELSETTKRSWLGKWFTGKRTAQKSRMIKVVAIGALITVALVLSKNRSVRQEPEEAGKVDIGLDKTVLEESWYVRATEEMGRQQQALQEMQEQIGKLSNRLREGNDAGLRPTPQPVKGEAQGDEVKESVTKDVYVAEAPRDEGAKLPVKPAYPSAPAYGETDVSSSSGASAGTRPAERNRGPVQALIHIEVESPKPSLAAEKGPHTSSLDTKDGVTAGSFAKVVLLTGADVATGLKAMKQPQPLLMAVKDLSVLPNRFKADLRRCVVTGEVFGSLSDQRAYVRANHLSCVAEDGRVFSQEIRAVMVGEDGKLGLRGRLVSRQGVFLARALVSSFIKGVAEAFKMQSTTVNLTPLGGTTQTYDPSQGFRMGFGQGMAEAVDRLSQMFMKMAEDTFPVIEVSAGRWGHLVFENDVELKPKYKFVSVRQ
jgi:conjugal transfer pilus assembly protein TraB